MKLKLLTNDKMLGQIYPTELWLNKANSFDTESPFLDLVLSTTNAIAPYNIYDECDDFNFEIVNYPFPDGDLHRFPSHVYIFRSLFRFARICSNASDINNRTTLLTA